LEKQKMYVIQTLQIDGNWLSPFKWENELFHSLHAAQTAADEQESQYMCPKRVINIETGAIIYTVGDTPEYQAFAQRVRAIIDAKENPSERFNMPTAFESRLNIWRNSMETQECFTTYQFEAVAVIDDILPPYGPQATNPAEHELAVSDVLGMYLMGEEL
jgi:hypothetical protein